MPSTKGATRSSAELMNRSHSNGTSKRETSSGAPSAVLYARVSSKDQEKEGYSIPAQETLLREYATETRSGDPARIRRRGDCQASRAWQLRRDARVPQAEPELPRAAG